MQKFLCWSSSFPQPFRFFFFSEAIGRTNNIDRFSVQLMNFSILMYGVLLLAIGSFIHFVYIPVVGIEVYAAKIIELTIMLSLASGCYFGLFTGMLRVLKLETDVHLENIDSGTFLREGLFIFKVLCMVGGCYGFLSLQTVLF